MVSSENLFTSLRRLICPYAYYRSARHIQKPPFKIQNKKPRISTNPGIKIISDLIFPRTSYVTYQSDNSFNIIHLHLLKTYPFGISM